MLLNRGETHRVLVGQGGNRVISTHGALDDVPPRRIGESVEDLVSSSLVDLIYNHSVVGLPDNFDLGKG